MSIHRFVHQNIWPSIDHELQDLSSEGFFNGVVLNAGAGIRDISHLVPGKLVNQDIAWPGDERKNIQVFSPIDKIPVGNDTYDCIICIAVLEHVINPEDCVREMYRVLKSGGHLVASVPFLQPEHKVPTDYQRYTKDGLEELFKRQGFAIVRIDPLFTVYHTIHWIIREWLILRNSMVYRALRLILLPILAFLARNSTLQSEKLASAFRILVKK